MRHFPSGTESSRVAARPTLTSPFSRRKNLKTKSQPATGGAVASRAGSRIARISKVYKSCRRDRSASRGDPTGLRRGGAPNPTPVAAGWPTRAFALEAAQTSAGTPGLRQDPRRGSQVGANAIHRHGPGGKADFLGGDRRLFGPQPQSMRLGIWSGRHRQPRSGTWRQVIRSKAPTRWRRVRPAVCDQGRPATRNGGHAIDLRATSRDGAAAAFGVR